MSSNFNFPVQGTLSAQALPSDVLISMNCDVGIGIFATSDQGAAAFAALKDGGQVVTWGDSDCGGNSEKVKMG